MGNVKTEIYGKNGSSSFSTIFKALFLNGVLHCNKRIIIYNKTENNQLISCAGLVNFLHAYIRYILL